MVEKIIKLFLNRKFITFGLIGLLNTLMAQVLYVLIASFTQLPVGIVAFISDMSLPMIVSYFLNLRFTYHEKPNIKSALSFPLSYIPGIAMGALVTEVAFMLGVSRQLSKFVPLPITVPLNFLCVSLVIKFSKQTSGTADSKKIKNG